MPERTIDVFETIQNPEARAMAAILSYSSEKFVNMINDRLDGLGDIILNYWAQLAESKSPWGARYASTLVKEVSSGTVTVMVDESNENSMFVNFVEKGIKPFSIKDKLLSGRKAQQNRALTGKTFVVVPFRWRTPAKTKSSSGAFSGTMSQEAYDLIRSGKKITPVVAQALGNPNLAGMQRTGGGYMTFRMVTPKSKGWLHPGHAATPVFDEVVAESEKMIEQVMLAMIDSFKEEAKKAALGGA